MTAEVYLLESNIDYEIPYTYLVPEDISKEIKEGVFVDVPFGAGNKSRIAVVWSVNLSDDVGRVKSNGFVIKAIASVNKNYLPLSKQEMNLCEQMKARYLCVMGVAVKCVMSPKVSAPRSVKYVSLNISGDEAHELIAANKLKNIGQVNIIDALIKYGDLSVSELQRDFGVTQSPINTLQKHGYISIYEKVECTDEDCLALESKAFSYPEHLLNDEQQAAFDKISELHGNGNFSEMLLHGVTASGKTEVYLHAIAEVINRGGRAILLVPEISLTPQMVSRFIGRFGNCAAILHSRLTEKQKYNEWLKIKNGTVSVAIGARSAVFAPFEKVDLFIIDEEQEPSYKSEDLAPRYHACDIAAMRAKMYNSLVVYGSATPRICTYYRAAQGEIYYAKMQSRANKNVLPSTYIIDMREDYDRGVSEIFGRTLLGELRKNYENKEQSILFMQRRGFSKQLTCRTCGKVMRCRKCNIAMTYHSKSNRLICHYCGNTSLAPNVCPSCGTADFEFKGFGTERVENELKRLFPCCNTVRMDTDTTSEKDGHAKLLSKFAEEKADFLVGTQMIAKGHDFPDVTLVGIVSADSLINMQEYNSSERAFQLMAQVAGRAGRAEKEGRAIIQAYNIDDYTVNTAATQNYEEFYKNEITLREMLNYPPFCHMAFVNFSCENDRMAYDFGVKVQTKLNELIEEESQSELPNGVGYKVEVLKPTRQPVSKVNGWYRWRIVVKCDDVKKVLNLAEKLMYNMSGLKKTVKEVIRYNIDIVY